MTFPFVSRLAFDVMQARAEQAESRLDALLERYHALRVQGSATHKPTIPAPIPPVTDPEQRILEDAEQEFVRQASNEFQKRGMSESQAQQAANALRQSVALTDAVPFGLS